MKIFEVKAAASPSSVCCWNDVPPKQTHLFNQNLILQMFESFVYEQLSPLLVWSDSLGALDINYFIIYS